MQRTILITGGAGFIGSALIRLLIKNTDHIVINYDKLTYASNLKALSEIKNNSRYHFIHNDICNSNAVNSALEKYTPDIIIHLAAESHVDNSISSSLEFINTNIIGTYVMIMAFKEYWEKKNKPNYYKFIHISTDEVYGDLNKEEPKFTINSPYKPSSPYSASKASSDHLVHAWHRTYNLPCILIHCSNNYGLFQHPEKFIPTIILKALNKQGIPVYGDGSNIRDWLYVEDHAEALLMVLENGKAGQTYNIGGNSEIKNIDLAHIICNILDKLKPLEDNKSYKQLIKTVQDRLGHDKRYGVDISFIQQQLGWQPKTNFLHGIEKTVNWYLKQYG